MSFCQKHTNHHCIHAHNCSSHNHKICDPNKKKSNKKSEIPRILCRDSGPLKRITERNHDNSSCSFNNSPSPNHHNKCQNCSNLNKLLEESRKEATDVLKQRMQLDGKYRKMCDQNRQLSGVVEYYRGEIDRISKCSQEDVRTQIRKHMKQHTQLSAKNKYLLSKLHQLQLQLHKTQSQLQQSSHLLSTTVQKNNQLVQSNNVLSQKLKKLHKSECELKQNCQSLGKQHKNSKDHLQILIKQSYINVDRNQKQNRKLEKQNKELKAELEVMRVKMGNVEKLGVMEVGMLKEREVGMKGKIGELGKEIGGLRETVADLVKKLKLKQEQLQYSKKVIQKQLNQLKQTKKLSEYLQQNSSPNPQPQPSHSTEPQKQNKVPPLPNNPKQNEYSNTEIKQLTQKIRLLQLQLQKQRQKSVPSSQAIQQYILTIGASEAFRKIIEEKNVYIKKLIREKGEILRAQP